MMSTRRTVTLAGCLAIVYLVWWPVEIQPESWEPPRNPGFSGPFHQNDALHRMDRLLDGFGPGPETITFGPDGWGYTGLRDGRIIRFPPDGSRFEEFANTHGSPGGMEFDSAGQLIVADATLGLLSVDTDGQITILASGHEGRKFLFLDDLDVGQDGRVWFSDFSTRYAEYNDHYEFLEGQASGQLLTYDPRTRQTRVVLDGLRNPNGVALGPDEAFVLISETIGYTVKKLWLKGPQAGEVEVIIPDLPAMPDNITFDGELFWMAAFVERDPILDWVHPRSPAFKRLLARLPLRWIPSPARHSEFSFVVAFDGHGTIVHNLQDHTGRYGGTTSVVRHDGHLYIGSLTESAVGRIDVPSKRVAEF